MMWLTNAEKAQRIADARAAAKTEAEMAWAEGWRQPMKGRVCKLLGRVHTYVERDYLTEAVEAEFTKSINQQREVIVAKAEVMVADYKAGRLAKKNLGLTELERRLGCGRSMLAGAALDPVHRFHEQRQQCLDLWEEARKGAAPASGIQKKFCRCCNTTVLGQETINGFLPECWAEKQYWEAVDEGRMARLSA